MKKWSCLNQERNMHRSSTVYKPKQSKTVPKKTNEKINVRDDRRWTFSQEEALLGIILARRGVLMDLFLTYKHKLLASQDINWWTGLVWIICGLLWCFYQLFGLSFWRHPFTAEDPLVNKRCNATFLQICSDEETNSSTSWMTWGRGWAHFQQMFIFGWTPLLIHVTLHTHSSFKTRRRPQKLLNGYKCHHLICDIFETFLSQSFIWQMYRNHCFHIYIYISFFSCYCFTVKCIGWICPLKHDNTFIYLLQMYSVMVHSN